MCFQIGWYNAVLSPSLHLSYPDDTLGVVVLSTPAMFEQAFLPFMESRGWKGVSADPIDQCVKHCINNTVSEVGGCVWVGATSASLTAKTPGVLME